MKATIICSLLMQLKINPNKTFSYLCNVTIARTERINKQMRLFFLLLFAVQTYNIYALLQYWFQIPRFSFEMLDISKWRYTRYFKDMWQSHSKRYVIISANLSVLVTWKMIYTLLNSERQYKSCGQIKMIHEKGADKIFQITLGHFNWFQHLLPFFWNH